MENASYPSVAKRSRAASRISARSSSCRRRRRTSTFTMNSVHHTERRSPETNAIEHGGSKIVHNAPPIASVRSSAQVAVGRTHCKRETSVSYGAVRNENLEQLSPLTWTLRNVLITRHLQEF